MQKPVAVVVGVGPGLGGALVRRFSAEGYAVAAISRDIKNAESICTGVDDAVALSCDATDRAQTESTIARIREDMGRPEVLLYNAGGGVRGTIDEISEDDFAFSWQINAMGLFLWAKVLAPDMVDAGKGLIGVTGATASLRGKPLTTGFAAAKAAQRSLSQSLARDLGPKGVHVFYAIIDGGIDNPRTRDRQPDKPIESRLNADDIADTYWVVANQKRSAWTFEIDLRPHIENW
ncbi:MAG: SDR family NAD(P)-dependent oxidoreductase [Alphaproteobacteria bacterium]|jgi:NAD(P)-dependent dehydrogenase (short-subunit alcohol dehydrogenase family)|nr:SDR family NAD(P)-dependent oxidoreductase [Alphaproteobacteria bacterium]MBT4083721.1 SDR family NAD(P)-dependent oxidoreductase [Alphaproteobacteria bacterium]MBT4545243.1 SDR family NAD(P)-dependent oxidoreductase [Alphaproteobacteria bacterium]MBT5917202.1 SDR family NAD(P)-dependent oxidoreductase [Alphaproteobacteria bacterium]MBT6386205.1 SDR family NAD(P)-dependent oxidoreductase [Alphaproteobacteria bacterium]